MMGFPWTAFEPSSITVLQERSYSRVLHDIEQLASKLAPAGGSVI